MTLCKVGQNFFIVSNSLAPKTKSLLKTNQPKIMKKIILLTAVSLLLLISCRKEIDSSRIQQSEIAATLNSNSVHAVPINSQETFAVQGSAWNSCTQEFIDFSGTGHLEIRGMISDNKITFAQHVNVSNVKGLGRTSGTEYVGTSTFNYTNTFNFNTQFVYQQNSTTNYVALGGNGSFSIINDWHLTVNANGDVTFFFTTGGDIIECR
jgi:hypothetical protein